MIHEADLKREQLDFHHLVFYFGVKSDITSLNVSFSLDLQLLLNSQLHP